jgi:hypothetical protein
MFIDVVAVLLFSYRHGWLVSFSSIIVDGSVSNDIGSSSLDLTENQ